MTAHARAINIEDAAAIEADLENVRISIRDKLFGFATPREVEAAVECVLMLRSYLWQWGLWADWSRDIEAAIASCDANGLGHLGARLRAYLAGLYEARGDWNEVLAISEKVLRSTTDAEALGDALFHRGTALHNLGCSRKALSAYSKARDFAKDSARRAAIDHKLSRVLKVLGRRDLAETHVDRALQVARATGDQWFYAELLLDKIGYLNCRELERSLKLAEESLAIYANVGFARGIAYAEMQCGRVLSLLGDDRRSDDLLERALRRFRRESYLPGQSHAHFVRGLLRLANGRVEESHEDFKEARTTAKDSNYRRMVVAATSGALVASIRGRRRILETLLMVFGMQDWWKVLSLAFHIQLRGVKSVLMEGARA